MEERKTILEVKNLKVGFETDHGTVYAVRDVSFHVKEGEILGIVGESGSGKSVSMYAVMGLLAANGQIASGEIVFDGENIAHGVDSALTCIEIHLKVLYFQYGFFLVHGHLLSASRGRGPHLSRLR